MVQQKLVGTKRPQKWAEGIIGGGGNKSEYEGGEREIKGGRETPDKEWVERKEADMESKSVKGKRREGCKEE